MLLTLNFANLLLQQRNSSVYAQCVYQKTFVIMLISCAKSPIYHFPWPKGAYGEHFLFEAFDFLSHETAVTSDFVIAGMMCLIYLLLLFQIFCISEIKIKISWQVIIKCWNYHYNQYKLLNKWRTHHCGELPSWKLGKIGKNHKYKINW